MNSVANSSVGFVVVYATRSTKSLKRYATKVEAEAQASRIASKGKDARVCWTVDSSNGYTVSEFYGKVGT